MKLNLPTWAAVVIWLGSFGVYAGLLLGNALDGLFPFFIYLFCAGISWIMCGASYGVLPSVKAYRETLKQLGNTYRPEADAASNRDKALGYWKWYAWCIALPLLVTIGYHLQVAGYW